MVEENIEKDEIIGKLQTEIERHTSSADIKDLRESLRLLNIYKKVSLRPQVVAGRPIFIPVKRVVKKLTGWYVEGALGQTVSQLELFNSYNLKILTQMVEQLSRISRRLDAIETRMKKLE